MEKYNLACPICTGGKLNKVGQLENDPIFYCNKENHFFILRYFEETKRYLILYPPHGSDDASIEKYSVPDSWTCDPAIVFIDERIRDYLLDPASVPLLLDMRPIIKKILLDGDIVIVTDKKSNHLGRISLKEGNFIFERFLNIFGPYR